MTKNQDQSYWRVGKDLQIVRVVRFILFPYRLAVWLMFVFLPIYFIVMYSRAPPLYISDRLFDQFFYTMVGAAAINAVFSIAIYFINLSAFKTVKEIAFDAAFHLQLGGLVTYLIASICVFIVGAIMIDWLYWYNLSVLENVAAGTPYPDPLVEFLWMDHNNTAKAIPSILGAILFLFIIRLFQALTMFKLNSWAVNQRINHPDIVGLKKIVEGSNLMRAGAVLEILFLPLGYILTNIGLKIAGQGFRSYKHPISPQKPKNHSVVEELSEKTVKKPGFSPTLNDKSEVTVCPSCRRKVRIDPGEKFCWNCGGIL